MQYIRNVLLATGLCMIIVPAQAKTIHVTVEKLAFSPAKIEAHVGDIIEWDNKDAIRHTATVKGGFDIILPPKKVTRQELKTAQSVQYYCRYHPDMIGNLVVKP